MRKRSAGRRVDQAQRSATDRGADLHVSTFHVRHCCSEQKSTSSMLTKYITAVSAHFSPFNARSGKTARNFLALLPPNARSTMAIDIKMGGRNAAAQPASLALKFSTSLLQ